jgi:simple sugar transport system ATP-binding protein
MSRSKSRSKFMPAIFPILAPFDSDPDMKVVVSGLKMTREYLRLENICKRFAGVQALCGISLIVERGETCCLVGENGSGKSTLIKVIAGVYPPDSGEIILDGIGYKRLHPIDSIRHGIQIIYQDLSLFPNLTVAENIALNWQISNSRRWVHRKEVERIARQALEKIDVSLDPGAQVGSLAVADRQLVAIARALLSDARLVIMDEPTAALTQKEIRSLFRVIDSLKKDGIATLFVSHKLDEVQEIADRVVVLRNGAKVLDCRTPALDRAAIAEAIAGRSAGLEHPPPADAHPEATVLLQVEKLSVNRCFSDISFELRAGEILGITGLLGSGRTALALSLFGLLPAESGQVRIDGRTVRLRRVQDALANGIAYIPEDRLQEGLFLDQSIGNNVVARVIDRLRGRFGLIDAPLKQARIRDWVDRLDIRTPSAELPAASLSGGNQQRVVLAKWLASDPRILILNGPTVGVDIGAKAAIHEIIRDLARRGLGLVVISDDIPELMRLCRRILVMKKGRIHEKFSAREISETQLSAVLVST